MTHPRHIVVVSCLVRNRTGQILAVCHRRRGWELPQGRVEQGESLLGALHREVAEETGVTIANARLAAVWSKLSPPVALIHGFIADFAAGSLTTSIETPGAAWLTVAEACECFDHPVNRDRLADLLGFRERIGFFSYMTGPYRRVGDTAPV